MHALVSISVNCNNTPILIMCFRLFFYFQIVVQMLLTNSVMQLAKSSFAKQIYKYVNRTIQTKLENSLLLLSQRKKKKCKTYNYNLFIYTWGLVYIQYKQKKVNNAYFLVRKSTGAIKCKFRLFAFCICQSIISFISIIPCQHNAIQKNIIYQRSVNTIFYVKSACTRWNYCK